MKPNASLPGLDLAPAIAAEGEPRLAYRQPGFARGFLVLRGRAHLSGLLAAIGSTETREWLIAATEGRTRSAQAIGHADEIPVEVQLGREPVRRVARPGPKGQLVEVKTSNGRSTQAFESEIWTAGEVTTIAWEWLTQGTAAGLELREPPAFAAEIAAGIRAD